MKSEEEDKQTGDRNKVDQIKHNQEIIELEGSTTQLHQSYQGLNQQSHLHKPLPEQTKH